MPTRALLLCADEKALAAITQVLSELGVPFEQPADSSSAAKRMSSQRFDVILIDCDQAQEAAQMFESVRSSMNQSAMTLAIVDGKAGVPGAFRLGAKLVLTKPLSLEQARGTLRNALAIQRRELPEGKARAAEPPKATLLDRNMDAAAEMPAPAPVAPAKPPASFKPVSWQRAEPETAPAPMARAAAAGTGIDDGVTAVPSPGLPPAPTASPSRKESAGPPPAKPARALDRSQENEDLLMCELEDDLDSRRKRNTVSAKTRKAQRKTNPAILALVAVLLLGAGFYAGWTMKPGFRTAVLAQYEELRVLITGKRATPPVAATKVTNPLPAKVSTQPVKATGSTAKAAASPAAPEGFSQAQNQVAPMGGTSSSTGAPAVVPTAASTDPDSGRGPLVVAAELAEQHVSHRVEPAYPEVARQKRLEGNVVLRAAINDDGSVDSVQVLDGNPRLVAAAVEAVRQWRFEIYYHNGQPSAFQTEITVKFQLPRKKSR